MKKAGRLSDFLANCYSLATSMALGLSEESARNLRGRELWETNKKRRKSAPKKS